MDRYSYKVHDRDGKIVLQAPESCRYDKKIERSIIASGYTIRLNGKRIMKKEIK